MTKRPVPSIDQVLGVLEDVAGQQLDRNTGLAELGVDSMDILQWLFEIEELLGIELDSLLGEETELEAFGVATLNEFYATMLRLVRQGDGTGSQA